MPTTQRTSKQFPFMINVLMIFFFVVHTVYMRVPKTSNISIYAAIVIILTEFCLHNRIQLSINSPLNSRLANKMPGNLTF